MKKLGAAILILMFLLFAIPLLLLKDKSEETKKSPQSKIDLEIKVYRKDLERIITMDFEEYILGVLAGEMPASFHIEALKAQSLAARTYTLLRMPHSVRQDAVITPKQIFAPIQPIARLTGIPQR